MANDMRPICSESHNVTQFATKSMNQWQIGIQSRAQSDRTQRTHRSFAQFSHVAVLGEQKTIGIVAPEWRRSWCFFFLSLCLLLTHIRDIPLRGGPPIRQLTLRTYAIWNWIIDICIKIEMWIWKWAKRCELEIIIRRVCGASPVFLQSAMPHAQGNLRRATRNRHQFVATKNNAPLPCVPFLFSLVY